MTKTAKTQGIFEVTSKVQGNNGFSLKGSSTQIEVCTRDYKTWCKKGKAPKTMQAEYDRVCKLAQAKEVDPEIIFSVKVLEVCATADELAKAKVRHGLVKTAITLPVEPLSAETLALLGLAPNPVTEPTTPTDPANPVTDRVVPLHPDVIAYNEQLAAAEYLRGNPAPFQDSMGLAPTTEELESLASNPAETEDLPATPTTELVIQVLPDEEPANPVAEPTVATSGKRKVKKTA